MLGYKAGFMLGVDTTTKATSILLEKLKNDINSIHVETRLSQKNFISLVGIVSFSFSLVLGIISILISSIQKKQQITKAANILNKTGWCCLIIYLFI
jgi:uncharacterized membrane protein YagU involved in acid resistance